MVQPNPCPHLSQRCTLKQSQDQVNLCRPSSFMNYVLVLKCRPSWSHTLGVNWKPNAGRGDREISTPKGFACQPGQILQAMFVLLSHTSK